MEITLQQLLEEAAREGGDLAALLRKYSSEGLLNSQQIADLVTEARAAFVKIQDSEELSTADLPQLNTIAATITDLVAEDTHLTEQTAATAAEVAQLAQAAGIEEPPAEGEGDAETPAEGDAEAPAEGDADNSDSGLTVEDITSAEVVDTTVEQPEPVAASARPRARVSLSSLGNRTPRPNPAQLTASAGGDDLPFGGSLVASMDAPGRIGGTAFNSWTALGQVVGNVWGSKTPQQLDSLVAGAARSGNAFSQSQGLAEFRKHFRPEAIAHTEDVTDAVNFVVNQANMESMVAAGGWCSPSETMYDLCDLPCSTDGILSLPEIQATRGGIRYTKGLDFCAIYNGAGFFHYTEAQMIAGQTKPCMEIPCVDFVDERLDVDGLCITGDIPQARTYPEVVAQFIQGAMCAHAHIMNARKIATIVAGSTNDGTIGVTGYGAANAVLYAIELEIQAYRYRGRRAQEGTPALLELVAPYWVKAVLRADIANRNAPSGVGNPMAVSDAEIVQWFATRGVAVRFVYDWQDLVDCNPSAGSPERAITDYPNTAEFLLYEAGTWINAALDVITLENLYDSALIKQNKYTALFTEEAFKVFNRCNGSRRFTVAICPSGNTGAQVAVTCAADVAATGAVAASGLFTPANATIPESLEDMAGIVASPTTAWTTGQGVQLGDGSYAHWNATAWVVGKA